MNKFNKYNSIKGASNIFTISNTNILGALKKYTKSQKVLFGNIYIKF